MAKDPVKDFFKSVEKFFSTKSFRTETTTTKKREKRLNKDNKYSVVVIDSKTGRIKNVIHKNVSKEKANEYVSFHENTGDFLGKNEVFRIFKD